MASEAFREAKQADRTKRQSTHDVLIQKLKREWGMVLYTEVLTEVARLPHVDFSFIKA